jgi:SAM-dependent methyltransferase
LFQVEPLIAKSILPWFGGSAAVWATCLLFFQVALLGGYAWAHWLSGQTPARQKIFYLAVLALSLLWLPILPSARWKPAAADDPLPHILGLLAATVGLPFFLLSATSPLLQSWRAGSDAASKPYRLYALSNLGSMLGLVSYPVLVEPYLTNHQQAWLWSIAYCAFATCAVAAAWKIPWSKLSARPAGIRACIPAPQAAQRLLWVGLAAAASALLLALTNVLTQNIAPMPFLWVLPLSLYLLSLILCFDSDRWYQRPVFTLLGVVALPVLAYAIAGADNIHDPKLAIALISAAAFVLFMMCHGELARRRPAPAHLTNFYLMVAAGGALGGVLVALAAPYLFNALYDPAIVVSLAGVLLLLVLRPSRPLAHPKLLLLAGLSIAYCQMLTARFGMLPLAGAALFAVCVYRVSRGRESLALYAMAVGLVAGVTGYLAQDTMHSVAHARVLARDFYGALTVYDQPSSGAMGPVRVLRHGTIEHGEQFLEAPYQEHPTTYYAGRSGGGLAIQALMERGPLRAGVIGLGAGTLAAYARPQDRYTFYEINPNVVRIAQAEFTFLRHSPAPVEVIPGDARLSLEAEPARQFDLLAVDAFSGDVIPVHLLTREAFQLYWRHLQPDGVLAVHVSSRYLSLAPVVALAAAEDARRAMMVWYGGDPARGESVSEWVLVTSRPGFFERPEIAAAARPIPSITGLRMWTDDYSNLYRILQ